MMRRLLRSLVLAALLPATSLAAAPPPDAGAAVSEAERRVFEDPHLDNLPAEATLHYRYRRTEAGQADVDDEVVLDARRGDGGGRAVRLDYLHGERHLALPDVDDAKSNPLILYFLEADVRDMHRRLGGQENYFRRRIRRALAESAKLSDVAVRHAGHVIEATRVEVRPYVDDPRPERLRGMVGKAYRFTLSPKVPGGVYELRTLVADAAGQPQLEEILTLSEDAGSGVRPTAPGYITEGKQQ